MFPFIFYVHISLLASTPPVDFPLLDALDKQAEGAMKIKMETY